MNTGARVAVLRLAGASVLVGAMLAAGLLHRSPWIIVLMTPVFTLLYALGKWAAWRTAWRMGGARQIAVAVLVTLPIQALVAAVFYLIGFGVGGLMAESSLPALNELDLLGAAALFVVGAGIASVILRSEALASRPSTAPAPASEIEIDSTPLTPETFFLAPHWRRNTVDDTREGKLVGADPELIEATEARLRVKLPEMLRRLYSRSNGGFVGDLYVPLRTDPRPVYDDWRGAFAIDYSSLTPLDELRTVADHYADFTDDPDDIPEHATRRLVLQARYGDMTLLDYSGGAEPQVLIVNYDKMGNDPIDIAFESFDAFFAALRRSPRR